MMTIHVKRVYETAAPADGFRVLVDRLWPRGLTHEKVNADLWMKEIAPSDELRQWFHSDRSMWQEFRSRYLAELELNPQPVAKLLELAARGPVTLLFAARDQEANHAVILAEYLLSKSKKHGV